MIIKMTHQSHHDLTLMMTSAQAVETSVNAINKSSSKDFTHLDLDDHTSSTYSNKITFVGIYCLYAHLQ